MSKRQRSQSSSVTVRPFLAFLEDFGLGVGEVANAPQIRQQILTLHSSLQKLRKESWKVTDHRNFDDFMMIGMPLLGKIYDKCLSGDRLIWTNPWAVLDSFKEFEGSSQVMQAIYTLLYQTVGYDGSIRDDLEPELVFFTRTMFYMFKKFRKECSDEAVFAAVSDFISIDTGLRPFSGSWNNDVWVRGRFRFSDHEHMHASEKSVARIMDRVFGSIVPMASPFDVDIITRHGPGAVADMQTGEDKYSFPFGHPNWMPSFLSLTIVSTGQTYISVIPTTFLVCQSLQRGLLPCRKLSTSLG